MAHYLQREFDDHPSLAASLEDFETPGTGSEPRFNFYSIRNPDVETDSDSTGPWSPPAWRRAGSGWFQHDTSRLAALPSPSYTRSSPSRSQEASPLDDGGDGDITLPANVPLPGSPEKGRSPSPSPEAGSYCNGQTGQMVGGTTEGEGQWQTLGTQQDQNNCRCCVDHWAKNETCSLGYRYTVELPR